MLNAIIGEVTTATGTYKVKGTGMLDTIKCYPHSHHFKNLPLRLTDSSASVRTIAQGESINVDGFQTPAQGAAHELKQPTNEPTVAEPIPSE